MQAKATTATFTVSSSGSFTGYVEAIEILNNDTKVHIGGGGLATLKPVEVEVYTSGSGGILLIIVKSLQS